MEYKYLNKFLSVRHGHLFIEDCDTVELAEKYGTPLFVVSENHLVKNLRSYRKAFESEWPEGKVRIMAAIKANPVTAIRKILTREGAGCDTFGKGELELALRGNVPLKDIAVNGSIKGREIISKAINLGIPIVLDSPIELLYCEQEAKFLKKKATVILRVKPWLKNLDLNSDFYPDRTIREMTQTVKYGIPHSELVDMIPQLKSSKWCDLVGFHTHAGRHSKKAAFWKALMRDYASLIGKISMLMGGDWVPRIVSVGGGFAASNDHETRVPVTDYETPTPKDYAKMITKQFRKSMQKLGLSTEGIVLEIEPGRALHNETAIHLTKVHNIKLERNYIARSWIETDTSECFLGIGSLNTNPPFDILLANRANSPEYAPYDVVGITCNYECIAEQVMMPEVAAKDILAFLNTGSYIETYACNFNALPRPGMLLVSGHKASWIKRPETQDEVFQRDIIPPWIN
ncbi:diaminopimelate decarboxylase family protein [Microbulbifer sp. ANSA002]|uniref:diaminopimelate decarboxylase family protein n=1 Tax=unclassified Microbulbifer TaxID=2619833 RepID=UPI004042A4C5